MSSTPLPLARRVAEIPDLVWAPFWEGVLILLAGATALWSGHPWLFTSLGPTAYEIVEKPKQPSSCTWNVVVGHFVGIGCGFVAVAATGAWSAPTVNAHSMVTPVRMWAAAIAVVLTVIVNLLLKSGQPAALATTLLVALGAMQTASAALWIAAGVCIIAIAGEPLRLLRLRGMRERERVENTS
ncbi:MAG: HPP family protein [Terriglobales bacterium]